MFLIIVSLIISFLNAFITQISQLVLTFIKHGSGTDRTEYEIRCEIADVVKQMSEVSIVDEFAKYARLQRTQDKLYNVLMKEVGKSYIKRLAISTTITYSLQAAIILATAVLFWTYRWVPVAQLPPEWLAPFSGLISWPTGQPGAIGFPVWFFVSNSFAKLVAKPFF